MKDISAYAKILSLAALVGMLHWRDLSALWQVSFSFSWIGFTLAILAFVFVFLYERRRALRTLVAISESDNGRGALFLVSAMIFYIFGFYTPYLLWLHLISLILFVTAYSTLMLDFRIPKTLVFPLVAMLFLVPPPIETRLFEMWSISSLVASTVIASFAAYTFKTSRWWKFVSRFFKRAETVKDAETCSVCGSNKMEKEVFCLHCGRQLSPPKPALTRFNFTNFFIVLLIVSILAFGSIPPFSLVGQQAAVTLNRIYVHFRDVFFTILSVASVFLFAGWARAKDERVERLSETAFFLSEDEALLLAAISTMKRRKSTGKAILDAYKGLTKSDEDIGRFYEKLYRLFKLGLVKRDYVLKNSELMMVWKGEAP